MIARRYWSIISNTDWRETVIKGISFQVISNQQLTIISSDSTDGRAIGDIPIYMAEKAMLI